MIPKIIHTVWIGDLPRPKFTARWGEYNPDYEFHLWDNSSVLRQMPLSNQHLYDQYDHEEENVWNGRTNLLRLELLYEYGGIYIDADIEPLRPLEDFLHTVPLFMAYANEGARGDLLNNAVIGAEPGEPFIKKAIDRLHQHEKLKQPSHIFSGPTFLTNLAKEVGDYDRIYKLPSWTFYPKWYQPGHDYKGDLPPFGLHHWGQTRKVYGKI